MAHSDNSSIDKMLSSRYELTKVFGVMNLFKDIHTLREQRFQGTDTTLLSCTLIDFERMIEKANLTEKQKTVIWYHFELDFTQGEVAEIMEITQQAVSKHLDNAITKIVAVAKKEDNMR